MMFIRKFVSEDAEKLSRLIIQNLQHVNIRDYPQDTIDALTLHFTPEKIIELSKNAYMIVCVQEGVLLGTATLDGDRVRNVFVNIESHKQGFGRLLMADLEAFAIENGLTKIYLHAGLSAQGFYSKLNYESIKRIEHELDGHPLPVIKMEKVLSKA